MNIRSSAFRRLSILSLSMCALATASPASAQSGGDDERSPTVSASTTVPPNVHAFAGDSISTASPVMRAMDYVDHMSNRSFFLALLVLMGSALMASRTVAFNEYRGRRNRNREILRNGGGGDEDDERQAAVTFRSRRTQQDRANGWYFQVPTYMHVENPFRHGMVYPPPRAI